MPAQHGKIESHSTVYAVAGQSETRRVKYAEIIIAILGVLALAAAADQMTGKRGFGGTSLVAAVGAACGAFLAVRVFGVSTIEQWPWVIWALIASAACLVAFLLFRSKR
jgi:hypothetical protein